MATYFIRAKETAEMLELSEGKVYEIFRELNAELKKNGYTTVCGRVPRVYFNEKFFGGLDDEKVSG